MGVEVRVPGTAWEHVFWERMGRGRGQGGTGSRAMGISVDISMDISVGISVGRSAVQLPLQPLPLRPGVKGTRRREVFPGGGDLPCRARALPA